MRLVSILYLILVTSFVQGFKTAIVVGAGPSGLSTALILAKRHGYNVTILEAQQEIDAFDPKKAYPFLVQERGQKVLKLFPEIQGRLEDQGIPLEGTTSVISVPSDPAEIFDSTPKSIPFFTIVGRSFWIPRHEFNKILLDAVNEEETITLLTGVRCLSVGALGDGEIQVCTTTTTTDVGNGFEKMYKTSFLVAADGMNSKVRESLAVSPSLFPGWKNNRPSGFRVKRWFSPSSGLKFKSIQINSEAKVPVGDGTMYEIPFDTPINFAIRSAFTKATNSISLGLLPCKKRPTRTFNVIRTPSHEIWNVRDGNELRSWFARAFPRFDFSSSSALITQEEFDRFAQTKGLSLPPCQYSPELFVASPDSSSAPAAAAILIGDALHTFPPDLGQGVNAGLEDVFDLDESLSKHKDLRQAVSDYAARRGPESKALVKIVRFGAPFQYNQFGGMLTVKKVLWTVNFVGRMLLNKLTLGVTPPPAFVQINDSGVKYSTAIRRADTLTVCLWAIVAGVLCRCFRIPKMIG